MKPKSIFLFRCGVVIALFLLLIGCLPNIIIKSDDFHQLQAGSPLSELSPMTFAIKEFVDVRGIDPQHIGHRLFVDQPVSKIITTAIRKEFERNRHKTILYPTQSKTDFIIEGTIYKFSYLFNPGGPFSNAEVRTNVAVKFTISNGNKVLVRKYEGEYSRSFLYVSVTYIDSIDQAMLNMIKDMSTDQELYKFLRL